MPKVEKSGIYRDERGRGIKLFAGAVITDDVAAQYGVNEDAEVGEVEVHSNPTADADETPHGEKQYGSPDAGAEVRDGVESDGDGGEVAVPSAEVAERDAQPVDGSTTPSEIRQLGPAPENRMRPAPSETRSSRGRRRSHNATTDAELSQEAAGEPVAAADAIDDKDSE